MGHERHYHPAHYGYALNGGTMRITDETGVQTVTLETGSDYTSDGTAWHEVLNIGETPVIYLMVEERYAESVDHPLRTPGSHHRR
ncbi:hypothetical protein AAG594_13990 [Citromicrobium bathyomarinum]